MSELQPRRIFADEEARINWETTCEAEGIAATLAPEEAPLSPQTITFLPKDKERGLAVVFAVGTAWGTGIDNTLSVPQRTLDVLEKMSIPYEVV